MSLMTPTTSGRGRSARQQAPRQPDPGACLTGTGQAPTNPPGPRGRSWSRA
jgi:hypothetical protein